MTSTSDFDYDLPEDRIAQVPVEPRDAARLLVDRGPKRAPEHRTVADLAALVGSGDVIVVNDTRVLAARLRLHKATGGAVEVLLLERRPTDGEWEALVKPSRRVAEGTVLHDLSGAGAQVADARVTPARVTVGADLGDGRRLVHVADPGLILSVGEVPLPPYIHAPLADPARYQSVYARPQGESVAAPTAGLHLTQAVLDRCVEAGARVERLDLQIGLGTFRPIHTEQVEDHSMHSEGYRISAGTFEACRTADRVLAVGTTVVRALETAARTGCLSGRSELFIHCGFRFGVVDALLTNFHVPRSSLLVLVDAFVGNRWRQLYATALTEGYRFLSFGDAMLLGRRGSVG